MRLLYCAFVVTIFSSIGLKAQTDFYFVNDEAKLYKYDFRNCSATYIEQLADSNGLVLNIFDMAILDNGEFYYHTSSSIYHYNKEKGHLEFMSDLNLSCNPQISTSIFNAATKLNSNELLLNSSNGSLVKFNVNNNSIVCLGQISPTGNALVGGLVKHNEYYYSTGVVPHGVYRFKLNESEDGFSDVRFYPYSGLQGYFLISVKTSSEDENKSLVTSSLESPGFSFSSLEIENLNRSKICGNNNLGYFIFGAATYHPIEAPKQEIVCKELILPNIFTPNGDGINDKFKAIQGDSLSEMNLKIYNRYGIEVYSQNKGPIEWDGKQSGSNESKSSNYYYVLRFKNYCGEELVKKGAVMLLY